jgi:hypothetical protein
MIFQIPDQLLNSILDATHVKTIEYELMYISIYLLILINRNLNLDHIFSSSEELKCMIASLVHAGVRLDRDENHVNENNSIFSFETIL